MFKLSPEFFTIKDVARALKLTPRAVQSSIKRTGTVRGVKVNHKQGMVLFSATQYDKIIRT